MMNPFLINNYINPSYFCYRDQETEVLIQNINNQSNTVFFAQRRVGKTALIQHVFHQLNTKKEHKTIYLDIYSTQNLKAFTDQLANSIYKAFPEKKGIASRFWESIKLLRPVISINEITGGPEMSLDISHPSQIERTIPQILQFLEKQNTPVVIAIDEFQQILEYPEKNVEALLRTSIQQLQNVHFIFLGSNRKMMFEIFNNAKRPFYAGAKNLYLDKIPKKEYTAFIQTHFNENKRNISDKSIKLVLELTNRHTYYTQHLCHEIFAFNKKSNTEKTVYQALNKILSENEAMYYQYRNLLTTAQWELLTVLAKEEQTAKPYNQKFIKKYNLGAPTSIKRTLNALLEKELVFYQSKKEEAYYEVQDKFLMRWLQYK